MIYNSIESEYEEHPELVQLWKDVHYKMHGYEPIRTDFGDNQWRVFSPAKDLDDILDR